MTVCTDGCFGGHGAWCAECAAERRGADALPRGTVVAGYAMGRVLGRGGFAYTYLARDVRLGKVVAVKEFMPQDLAIRSLAGGGVTARSASDDSLYATLLDAFVTEARRLAQLRHRGIVEVLRLEEARGTAYLVMPYLPGETVWTRHRARQQARRPWRLGEVLALLSPIGAALEYVHGQVPPLIHRDIKPDNIFIVRDPEASGGERAMLLDFGAAKEVWHTAVRSTRRTDGLQFSSRGFSPLEQVRGGRQGPATDVYALSATIYLLLTGEAPPDVLDRLDPARDPLVPATRLRADLPEGAWVAVRAGLAVRANERTASVRALLDDLQMAVDKLGGAPASPGAAKRRPTAATASLLRKTVNAARRSLAAAITPAETAVKVAMAAIRFAVGAIMLIIVGTCTVNLVRQQITPALGSAGQRPPALRAP